MSKSSSTRQFWLLKSEPDCFSFEDLWNAPRRRTGWNGIRNYQARNFMRDAMHVGDGVLYYHSGAEPPGVAGIARVASAAYPDPTQFDPKSDYFDAKSSRDEPRWSLIDVKYKRKLKRTIALTELKDRPELDGFALVHRGNRLSVLPVTKAQWDFILGLE